MDEALFGRRKYHKGRAIPGKWIFGGVERHDKKKMFFVPVENRSQEVLEREIKKNIVDESIIISDCWAGYVNIEAHNGYTHMTVNHKENFVDPMSGAHT